MLKLYITLQALLQKRDRGATALEYALLVTFIAAALVAVVTTFRTGIGNILTDACNAIGGAGTC